jgi:nucleoside-diphosphate-sugar epimerase
MASMLFDEGSREGHAACTSRFETCDPRGNTMKIFVTGASGFVGSAVVRELLHAGHRVLGLARTEAASQLIARVGATPHHGDLEDLDTLRSGASASDAVIHTGFIHDFANFKQCCELDRRVIDALGGALAGSARPLVVTSAIGLLPRGHVTERTMPLSPNPNPRVATEEACRALLDRGVNVSIVRLPPSTHGEGDHGFVPMLIQLARERGASAYVGDGSNLWSATHRFDAAKVYRLALERAEKGSFYHAVAEAGIPFRQIAEVISRRLSLPLVSKTPEEATAHFGWFAHFASLSLEASSEQTQQQLGWRPALHGLLADLEEGHYFPAS